MAASSPSHNRGSGGLLLRLNGLGCSRPLMKEMMHDHIIVLEHQVYIHLNDMVACAIFSDKSFCTKYTSWYFYNFLNVLNLLNLYHWQLLETQVVLLLCNL